MGVLSPALFSNEIAEIIRREYSILLSVGKTGEEAEKALIEYFSSIFNCNNPNENVFWLILARCEWKKGRLTELAKSKALTILEEGRDLEYWKKAGNEKNYEKRKKVLDELKELLLSPQPPMKKVKKPTVHHCPWKVGSLLAYRMVTNKDYLCQRNCYMKYVLLRVVKVNKRPISNRFDTGYYNESMLVGLYNWIGDEIPDCEIVNSLEYIPIFTMPPIGLSEDVIESLTSGLSGGLSDALKEHFKGTTEKCVWFDWRPFQEYTGDITLLDCDENFEDNIPEFFKPRPHSTVYTHFIPMDAHLAKIFGEKPQ